ncbi:MAG: 2-oxoglutarate dehydrogenase complex dihydrolipoyllysine-residue succinyltransferase [Gammaproteobacteria bacterium]|nr:2-oxoglutarate dehydrogenase complex dihydrolipoyllysine-residue succinyltransferase [Gammaproteobacteria bacterium]
MLVDVKVPVLAESVAEATLMSWHRKAGDSVKRGDTLIDIETDKVTLEVAAPNDGVLTEILRGDGETVSSDEIIARIEIRSGADKPAPARAETVPAAVQPQKAAPPPAAPPPATPPAASPAATPPAEPRLSPAVRMLLQEHRLDPAKIRATGPAGRLTQEDVLNHIKQGKRAPAAAKSETARMQSTTPQPASEPRAAAAAPAQAPAPHAAPEPPRASTPQSPPAARAETAPAADAGSRPQERVPMTRLRRRAAERLLAAQRDNALLTTFNEVNMQAVLDFRARYKEAFESAYGVRLGFMSFFVKAAVEALKKFPIVNASVDGTDIVYHGYFDVGIAVSSPRGLVVPILRDADVLSFAKIESSIREFGEKARDGKLTIEELTGGTFTITNGGVFGSLLSTPIINPPQSAILGMHKIQERPVAENGAVVVRPMMYLALTYDHRIIDGRDAVQFLVAIKELIEEPSRLLLQV